MPIFSSQNSIFDWFFVIFDQNKPKLAIWNGFRQLFSNFEPFSSISKKFWKFFAPVWSPSHPMYATYSANISQLQSSKLLLRWLKRWFRWSCRILWFWFPLRCRLRYFACLGWGRRIGWSLFLRLRTDPFLVIFGCLALAPLFERVFWTKSISNSGLSILNNFRRWVFFYFFEILSI